ncbi:probable protein phosphatase CG10417 [Microplitis demolitor]|uniref:probable protein phosphatase CG10417 n=1 Tax=Microplitis demolitor TaxID=69319 RepID=UPI0004CD63F8|nr:probable protein phosphatase CG10417 [Microplitis demolitor]
MGAYLSEPVTTKESTDDSGKNVAFGASSMQGWRISQEDAHNCCIDFDENVSLFAVYDGHGGHEVASYCAKKLPEFIKETEAYKRGDIRQALIDAFLGFDATLATPEIIKVLKEISKNTGTEKTKEEAETDDEDNVSNLKQEAEMPLEQVMAKYLADTQAGADRFGKRIISSPLIRCRRTKDRGDPSAGCSSTSSNEADVSSSCQSDGSSAGAAGSAGAGPSPSPGDESKVESPKSSEAEQTLDSTTSTSNGEVAHKKESDKLDSKVSEPVKADDKIGEAVKDGKVETVKDNADMPDSSEDSDTKVSPSKTEHTADNKEVNGSELKVKTKDEDGKNNDNVTSSSTLENGETSQEGISSVGRRLLIEPFFRSLLTPITDSDDDDDDEDENDENFDGPESASDTDEIDDSDEIDEDDDEDEEDDEDDMDDGDITVNEEPGSDSGCTAVVAILQGDDLYVANAGDSRCVLCRDGQALELSLDHKPEDDPEMKRIVNAGGKVTADGRVNGGLNLSRALGDHAYKQNTKLPAQDQMISAMPDVRHVKVDPQRDDFLILACDGIWNFMTSAEVVKFVQERINTENKSLSSICEELFDHCLAPDTCGDGTGCDNMTAVIVKFKSSKPADVNSEKIEDTNNLTAKKRPLSPADSNEQTEPTEPADECKRAKVETV